MNEMLFWVEASPEAGIGHLIRCMALAQAARLRGVHCLFLLNENARKIALTQHDWEFPIIAIKDSDDAEQIAKLILTQHPDVLVVDGYTLPVTVLADIRQSIKSIVVLDDGELRLTPYADVVINGASSDNDSVYRQQRDSVYCCTGSKYRLLRQNFLAIDIKSVALRHGIVICFGGSDPAALTIPLLKAFDKTATQVPVRVITGAAYPDHKKIKNLCSKLQFPMQHIHQCQDMAQAWVDAKLAISAAGGSQFELGVCNTPSILVTVAENQHSATQVAQAQGWCRAVNKDIDINELVAMALALYSDEETLTEMQACSQGNYDALGSERAIDAIIKVFNDADNDKN
jgi:UDP-2,4-diacetamido-2,4,6-trideoxy-beta-L-altropyranose hydrolase|tara:strand:+ start:272 stop:1303 length:1032 start_codon:yes stop_codon:yes gene_type:complete